jgi:hypothetical protein
MEVYMRRFLLSLLVVLFGGSALLAQNVPSGSKLYIEPMGGYETYLTAAILSKKVPVTVVLDKAPADYNVVGNWKEEDGGTSGNGSLVSPLHKRTNYSLNASVADPKTSAVVFSYSSQKSESHDASKEIAEDWASHLRDSMIGKKK